MTQQANDTVATGVDPRIKARTVYLDAVKTFIETRGQGGRGAVLIAYAHCLGGGKPLSDDVSAKISKMLGDLVRRDENAWAKFLSVHVGFTDMRALAMFKDISPFSTRVIVEQDAYTDFNQKTIALRGESRRFLAAVHGKRVADTLVIPISTQVKHEGMTKAMRIERSFIVILELASPA